MKYFVASDIHGFLDELIAGLDSAGFDRANPEHVLVIGGDLFDRGSQPVELYEYLMSLPSERLILIEGNHELLFRNLMLKNIPQRHDFTNGTVKTFCDIAGTPYASIVNWYNESVVYFIPTEEKERVLKEGSELWVLVRQKVEESPVGKLVLNEANFKKFLEIGPFIIVHSFIPVVIHGMDWRTDPSADWNEAEWGCPYKMYDDGLFLTEMSFGKRLICGHWHSADFHTHYEGAEEWSDYSPYCGEHLIAIDACTAQSHLVNVVVIDDSDMSISYQNEPLRPKDNNKEPYIMLTRFGWKEL